MSCILLTGACGRLGRYVLEALGHRRHQVRTFDKAPAPECAGHIRADVLDRVSVRSAMTGVETVVHLAALDASVSAPEQQFFEVNVQGTWNVLEAAEQAGVQRVVLCSSVAVLGLADDRPPDSLPIDETHVCRPYQAYGLSKQIAEITAECFARRGRLQVVCLRPAFVAFDDLLGGVVQALAESDGVQWPNGKSGDGDSIGEPLTPTRSYVGPEDCARCVVSAVETRISAAYRVYLVTAPWSMSPAPTVERAVAMGMPEETVRGIALYVDQPTASMFSAHRAERELGWCARTHFEDLLKAVNPGNGPPTLSD